MVSAEWMILSTTKLPKAELSLTIKMKIAFTAHWSHSVCYEGVQAQNLHNIATKDVATKEIESDLLNASSDGQKQLNQFVEERLSSTGKKFRDPLHKNKSMTFSSLFEPKKNLKAEKEKVIRADRLVLQRLISPYEAGRGINLDEILKHELLPIPVALAEMNGNLQTGSKAILGVDMQNASLIIDGQALVLAIGNHQDLQHLEILLIHLYRLY